VGEVIRLDDSEVNPYCILVRIDGETEVCCFKPTHLNLEKEVDK
jgi:hypothetical protein